LNVDGAFGPAVAVAAGTVSFLSPCVLPLVPIYAAQMAGASTPGAAKVSRRDTALRCVSFIAGFSAVFVSLGASVGLGAYFLRDHIEELTRASGLILIVLGLHQSGIIRIPLLYRAFGGGSDTRPHGYVGWAVVGGAVSISWVPCIGPALASILTLAAESATVAKGAVLLGFYSLGLGIPFLAVGLLAGSAGSTLKRMRGWMPVIELVSGIVLIIAGILIFTNEFTRLNRYFEMFDIFGIGTDGGI
jgi:cytochrome c-type biogenesis protein